MSGQRVTGVVVGGEEVSAKEVQLLSKKSAGSRYYQVVFLEIWSKSYGATNMSW